MTMQPIPDGLVVLTHWGLMRARGADAVKFLQGQLTNDIATLGADRARLAGFCSAKGRLQASFVVWQFAPDDLLLACHASVLPATLKRLSMFVLRAQCKLSDAGSEWRLLGAVGATARHWTADLPVWGQRAAAGGSTVRLPDVDGLPRALLAQPLAESLPSAPDFALDAWRLLEVRSAIPVIEAATVDQFVPQMLNYEVVGGVDFQKGCYPGQEVVARSQYRGTIKRRMFLFAVDEAGHAGQEVFHSADPAQPAGMVVNAAPQAGTPGSGVVLVEVKLAALEGGSLHLGHAGGPSLRQLELPYPLPGEAALLA
jgi:folate-binding protein YgfZ